MEQGLEEVQVVIVEMDEDVFIERLSEANELPDEKLSKKVLARVTPRTKERLIVMSDAVGRSQSSLVGSFVRRGLNTLERQLVG